MVDLTATAVAALIGLIGAVVWWILPPSPKQTVEVAKRLIAGAIAGFFWYAVFDASPFDAARNWNSKGILQLLVVGFTSLASLGALVPAHFNAESEEFAERTK